MKLLPSRFQVHSPFCPVSWKWIDGAVLVGWLACLGFLPAQLFQTPVRELSSVTFTDVARSSGVEFRHFDPETDKQYISETIGSGAGWIDFDGDGYLDLVLVNSAPLPGSIHVPAEPPRNQFFRNLRDGKFEDVTDRTWVCPPGFGQGCAVGDLDNDGFDDLYVSYYLGPNRLFHNNGDGTFGRMSVEPLSVDRDRVDLNTSTAEQRTDFTLNAQHSTSQRPWSTSCAWSDLDGDGDLDLYVCNYLEMPLDTYPFCGDPRHKVRTLCSPMKFAAQPDVVYCNQGDGSFLDTSEAWGFRRKLEDRGQESDGRGLGVVIADLDDDGLPDVYVANDRSPNLLYRNLGGGRFEEQGLLSGCAVSADGQALAGMGVDAGDVDGNGLLDLFVTNFFHEPNTLFRNDGRCQFREIGMRSGLGRPSFQRLGFGCGLFDANNDGHLDVFVANGHVDRIPERHGFPEPYRQRAQLFLGDGSGRFAEVVNAAKGSYFSEPHVGRAAALADYDNDGDMDVAVNHNGEAAALLRNEATNSVDWLRIELIGTIGNRNGFGTQIIADLGDRQIVQQVIGGRSYLAAHDLRVLLGLGGNARISSLKIRWPAGSSQKLESIAARQTITLREASSH